MPPPLPGIIPGLPQFPPQQSYNTPAAPSVPTVPKPSPGPVGPSPVLEPSAEGINEVPCQAVHVPPEENFFTVRLIVDQGSKVVDISFLTRVHSVE